MGTLSYMAPEQKESAVKTTKLSDIYSLGVVLHELFFGVKPASLNSKVVPERMRPLKALITDCIDPDPASRPQDADEVKNRLLFIGEHLRRFRVPFGVRFQNGRALLLDGECLGQSLTLEFAERRGITRNVSGELGDQDVPSR